MKPNDKAIEAALNAFYMTRAEAEHEPNIVCMRRAVDAAFAAQFQSEDYAGLVKQLRFIDSVKQLRFIDEDTLYIEPYFCEQSCKSAADAIEALLAERDALNFELAARKEWPQARAEMLDELAKVRAERDALKVTADSHVKGWMHQCDKATAAIKERDALLARLAPVDDEALVDIAVETWIEATTGLARRPSAYTISERAGARAVIAAIRPHIEAAERERCAKIAETPDLWVTDKPTRGCDDIAAAIRSGK